MGRFPPVKKEGLEPESGSVKRLTAGALSDVLSAALGIEKEPAMEVILKEDIPNVGKMGEVVRVRDGYARNYLLPRGLVLVANKKNLKVYEHQKRVVDSQKDRVQQHAQGLVDKLSGVALVIPARVGEEGRLFGSVTNIDIEKALKAQGFEVER